MEIPRVVYCCWTGENEITPNRVRSLGMMCANIGVPVVLITSKNLKDFIVPDYPLHPAYQYLSLNHKSDYIRVYMMHLYGGAYSDIKESYESWVPAFKETDWITGYPEIGTWSVGWPEHAHLWPQLIGCGAFVVRPRTAFTEEWFNEVNKLLDEKLEDLMKHPATDGSCYNESKDYPLEWVEVMGKIFHRILPKYFDHVKQTLPPPNFRDYR
jgi:hypothetical protein